ncbi:hypothetical protein D4R86_04310 [bacterium]|nr:MAG: hypothetical protein D4R86_04310 [bacterium]
MGQPDISRKDQNDTKAFKSQSDLGQLGDYKNASIFVICNGPSFAKLDHSLLRQPGIITYGMNNGPKTFRPNFWSCVDSPSRFLMSIWKDPKITKFVPFGSANKPLFNSYTWSMTNDYVKDCPNVIGFRRNEKFNPSTFLTEDTFNWGNHKDDGGGRSVMLPIMRICYELGFRKIYLLGCDFNMSETNTYHFDEQRDKGAVKGNRKTYGRLENEYFPQLKPFFDEKGFKVYNCNPESGLTCFPYVSFEEAIATTIAPLGDIANERTWGLYSGDKKKAAFKAEPPPVAKKNLQTTNEKPVPIAKPEPEPVAVTIVHTPALGAISSNNTGDVDIEESSGVEEVEEILIRQIEPEMPIVKTFADTLTEDIPLINIPEPEIVKTFIDMPLIEELEELPEPKVVKEFVDSIDKAGIAKLIKIQDFDTQASKEIVNKLRTANKQIVFPPSQPPIKY